MFKVGDRVDRVENRQQTGATVLSINESINESIIENPNPEENAEVVQKVILELSYDEGGSGWWPAECVQLRENV
jgi:hypothetical protein